MSHEYWAATDKHQKRSKVHFGQYLTNFHEPLDNSSNDLPIEQELELMENSHIMKRQLRNLARINRNHPL